MEAYTKEKGWLIVGIYIDAAKIFCFYEKEFNTSFGVPVSFKILSYSFITIFVVSLVSLTFEAETLLDTDKILEADNIIDKPNVLIIFVSFFIPP